MKRIVFFVFFCFAIFTTETAFSQNTANDTGRPTFTLPHCYTSSLLSQPVCMTQDYFQDEFYVLLKDKSKTAPNFTLQGQVNSLQTAVANGTVDQYHNELQRIEEMSEINFVVKNLAAQTDFGRIVHVHIKNHNDFLTKDIDANSLILKFKQDPEVESVSLSSVVRTTQRSSQELPYNDPLAINQYSLKMTKAIEAHTKYGFGSRLAIIGVFDTGCTHDHQDLANKCIFDHVSATGAFISKMDRFGHGTHVTGIASANANNNEGIVGMCPECPVWNVKVLNDGGFGNWDWVVDGIVTATSKFHEFKQQNPLASMVFNFSLAGMGPISIVDAALALAYKEDIVVVAAAGNEGVKIGPGGLSFYPASAPGVLVAEAVNEAGNLASWSNYGPLLISGECPGVDIWSTVPAHGNPIGDLSGYAKESGTSMAAPCVSGAIGHVRGTAALRGQTIKRELIQGDYQASATPLSGHEKFSASGGVLNMLDLHEIPLTPPGPVTDFGIFGINWGSNWIALTSVNDSLGKPVIGFLVSYSKNQFDASTIERKDITTIRYNIKRGLGEGVNLRTPYLDQATQYYITVRPFDKALNVGPLPQNGVLQFTTQRAEVFPGAKWTFTKADGNKDASGFKPDYGPFAWFFELFFGPNKLLWHLSDIISDFKDLRWNWWFGNPQTLGYKTSTFSDSTLMSPVLDLTDMHYGAELIMDYFQQLLSIVAQVQDQFEIYAEILDENNLFVDDILLFQSIGEAKNSTALRMAPIRMDLAPVRDLWLENQEKINDGSLDRLHVVIVFRFLSVTRGSAGGIGSIFGNLQILQNPQ